MRMAITSSATAATVTPSAFASPSATARCAPADLQRDDHVNGDRHQPADCLPGRRELWSAGGVEHSGQQGDHRPTDEADREGGDGRREHRVPVLMLVLQDVRDRRRGGN